MLIFSLVIKYLEERKVIEEDFFGRFLGSAKEFLKVLANGPAQVELWKHLEVRFNGNVFELEARDQQKLTESNQLARFARFVEARQERDGQFVKDTMSRFILPALSSV